MKLGLFVVSSTGQTLTNSADGDMRPVRAISADPRIKGGIRE
jgi:hypothetical protein